MRVVAERRKLFTNEEWQWHIGEPIGVLADYNPLSDPEEAGDKVLADCLLCAWEESTGGNCH